MESVASSYALRSGTARDLSLLRCALAFALDWRAGTALLAELCRIARAAGFGRLSLSVEASNPAEHLYRRLGFVGDRREGDAVVLVKDLR